MTRLRPILPFALILAWSCAVRLPFYGNVSDDEFFFSVIAQRWLEGGLPYVASYDVKPPGLFVIYALAQVLFGQSLATVKGLEILFTALGGFALYRLARRHGGPAVWCGLLYPVYSLALLGVNAANLILQLPFLIAAFAFLPRQDGGMTARDAFLAGLMVGMAGMLRQAIVVEALCVFVLFLWRRPSGRQTGLFIGGGALPLLAFALYFAAHGHLGDAWQAVVVAAIARSGGEVPVAHGAIPALHLTAWDVLGGPFAMAPPVLALVIMALLAFLRCDRLGDVHGLMRLSGLWLLAALLDVISARSMFPYYMLATVPPLLLLSGLFATSGLQAPDRRSWQAGLGAVALFWPLAAEHANLFPDGRTDSEDRLAAEGVAARMRQLGQRPGDRLLVINRGLLTYVAAQARPPTATFHPKHLLCEFPGTSADPLHEALAARPRFVVLADPSRVRPCEEPERLAEAQAMLAAGYRLDRTVAGAWDRYLLYQLRPSL